MSKPVDTSWQPWEQEDAEKFNDPALSEFAKAYDKLSPQQQRNVMNWGTAAGRGGPDAASLGTIDTPALSQLRSEFAQRALVNQNAINAQFGRNMPITGDTFFGLNPSNTGGLTEDKYAAAVLNPNRTQALADQMTRLETLYPGNVSRMQKLAIGRTGNEGWMEPQGFLGKDWPGAVKYQIGLPAEPAFLRGATGVTPTVSPPVASNGHGAFFAGNDEMYPGGMFHNVAAHEFGHAVHSSMEDFAQSLDPGRPLEAEARQAYEKFINRLGTSPASHISSYAEKARLNAGDVAGPAAASREPFAELFSVARSPQGMERFVGGDKNPDLLRAMVGERSGPHAERLLADVGEFNSVESKLRNVGYNSIGSVAPEMLMQVGLPALAGLAATKTHGTVRSALEGAAAGAGIGGFFGPEGTLAGAGLGAGAGLIRQLL